MLIPLSVSSLHKAKLGSNLITAVDQHLLLQQSAYTFLLHRVLREVISPLVKQVKDILKRAFFFFYGHNHLDLISVPHL